MISVVVPVYNVSDYLDECINSILNQTYTDLQIILVDDGSTDDSGKKCDLFAAADCRVKVIHKQNGGLMAAWKTGVENSDGEYIGFVDSDDYIDCDMYARLLEAALRDNSDIVASGIIREYGTHSEKETIYLEGGLYTRSDIEEKIFPIILSNGTMLNRGFSPNRVTKLFKRQLILNNLSFCDERVSLGEDLVTTFSCMCDANRVTILADLFAYHYNIRNTSIMGSYNPAFFKQTLLLNGVLSEIAAVKNVFDFDSQLVNDFVSLAYYGIERNISTAKVNKKEMVEYIKETALHDDFKAALKKETLSKNNKKCLIYKVLINCSLYGLLYSFILKAVIAARVKRFKKR